MNEMSTFPASAGFQQPASVKWELLPDMDTNYQAITSSFNAIYEANHAEISKLVTRYVNENPQLVNFLNQCNYQDVNYNSAAQKIFYHLTSLALSELKSYKCYEDQGEMNYKRSEQKVKKLTWEDRDNGMMKVSQCFSEQEAVMLEHSIVSRYFYDEIIEKKVIEERGHFKTIIPHQHVFVFPSSKSPGEFRVGIPASDFPKELDGHDVVLRKGMFTVRSIEKRRTCFGRIEFAALWGSPANRPAETGF